MLANIVSILAQEVVNHRHCLVGVALGVLNIVLTLVDEISLFSS
jgi:hypothetical protein